MSEPWRRHDLLRVEPGAWERVFSSYPQLTGVPHVAQWAARRWPLIVRRHAPGDDPRMIPAGFPLPPANGKLRLSVQVAPEDVSEWMPPLTLRAARQAAPVAWQRVVDALLGLAEQTGVEPRVFGSLMWQHLTGLSYLSAGSDLDLLWPVNNEAIATQLVRRLAFIEQGSPMRCDGEILLPDGGGVQWREWHESPAQVLVKTSSGVRLRGVLDLLPPLTSFS